MDASLQNDILKVMDTVTVNGVEYVKTSKAAQQAGYTADYVSQLCRKGALDAIVLGKTWYVSGVSLAAHKDSQRRNNTGLTRRDIENQKRDFDAARATLRYHAGFQTESRPRQRLPETEIRYGHDSRELLPLVVRPEPQDVIDASEQEEAPVARKLVPRAAEDIPLHLPPLPEEYAHLVTGATDFEPFEVSLGDREEDTPDSLAERGYRGRPFAVLVFLFLLFSVVSVFLESTWEYARTGAEIFEFETNYQFASVGSAENLLSRIQLYQSK